MNSWPGWMMTSELNVRYCQGIGPRCLRSHMEHPANREGRSLCHRPVYGRLDLSDLGHSNVQTSGRYCLGDEEIYQTTRWICRGSAPNPRLPRSIHFSRSDQVLSSGCIDQGCWQQGAYGCTAAGAEYTSVYPRSC